MPLGKCYALIHSLAESNGVNCVWADEEEANQEMVMEQARDIIRNNLVFRE